MSSFFILPWKTYRVRLEFDRDPFGRATMVKYFTTHTKAEARELARHELGLTWREAAQRLTVEDIS